VGDVTGAVGDITGAVIDALNGVIDALNGVIDALNGVIDALNGVIDALNGVIDALNAVIVYNIGVIVLNISGFVQKEIKMNIIAVDDEQFALMDLQAAIQEALPESAVHCFNTPAAALEHAKEALAQGNRVDVAFLDIEMGGMSGLELAKRLKDIYGKTNIVFVTGYSRYAVDAFALHASGYLLKPVTAKGILDNIDYLRHPVKKAARKRLFIQTFGNFEVFVDGKPVSFPRARSKEIFAYLVHKKGSNCTTRELDAVLHEKEDESKADSVRVYISAMIKTLEEAGFGDVIVKTYNGTSVDTTKFDCDFYRFLEMDADAVNEYTGEYMAQYTWAEFMTGYLTGKVL